MFIYIISLRILFPYSPNRSWGCVKMLNYFKEKILLFRSIIYQKTSGLGVPTGLP